MVIEKLKKYNIVLGSASPRRKALLAELKIKFTIKTTEEKEQYPQKLEGGKVAEFLAKQKAKFIFKKLSSNYLLITVDTIVMQNNEIIHKPKNKYDAIKMLKKLSSKSHKVISGVCLKTDEKEVIFSDTTEVFFNELSEEEIMYYIEKFNPFDKAGSYGIQEWIGYIGVQKIIGSYNNVVGLPTCKLYQKLKLFI